MLFSTENELPIPIETSIKNILEKEKIVNYKINWRHPKNSCGYLGKLYEIDIYGETNNEETILNLFVKQIVDGTSIKLLHLPNLYINELFAYQELFQIYAKMQDVADISEEEKFQTIKLYEGSNETFLTMDNIGKRGFIPLPRDKVLSLHVIELSITELAKFHGLSFVLKEVNPIYFAEKIKPLNHQYLFGEDWKEMIKNIQNTGVNDVDEIYKEKIDSVYEDLKHKLRDYRDDPTIKVCLCHGDFKNNNIMVTNNEIEKQTVMILDYQMIHYGCPVFDLLAFIYTTTDSKFRKIHMVYLKKLYYEMLGKLLKNFKLDIDTIYPRDDYEKVFKEKMDFGLMTTVLSLPFLMATGDNVPDVNKSEWQFKFNQGVKERYHDVIEEFIGQGYL